MRLLVFLGLIALSFGFYIEGDKYEEIDVEPFGIFEDTVRKIFEGSRKRLPEPMRVDNLTFALPGGPLNGSIAFEDLTLSGIKAFNISNLKFDLKGLNFSVEIPSINLNTDYKIDALIGSLVPIYGKGRANVNLKNLQITAYGNADLFPLRTKNLRVELSFERATFDLHGLLNDQDFSLIASSIMNDVVGRFVNEYRKLISDVVSPIIEKGINSILKGGKESEKKP